ncbi:ATP-binding SpoIIE family protein phosphatase [Streptomyces neyagawaensis]|uniref:ATP-binding SpoIIE family protein phosphatase n=2 Tax=Streptomyces neyagawaensis TaxID=42238 RepID=UPI00201CEE98|nr:ATP-binding SpoIIE family protein phosphatase [Streptomyces neyagawaensis]MCL6733623.1 SpoIIE family protein phosphatase [Streptomyces neyagawaensis]MDE1685436.1 SpoIIE family protein phosphatase [Streptomyces neyagawaensis]
MGAIPTQRETVPRSPDAPAHQENGSAPEGYAGAAYVGSVRAGADRRAVARLSLPGGPLAPGAARRFVGSALQEWTDLELPGADAFSGRLVEDVLVVVSELVTNAVVHAGTDVELLCRYDRDDRTASGWLVVEVSDHHPSRAVRDEGAARPYLVERPYGAAEYGRGLRLVAAVSEAWGITYRTSTKTVWARLSVDGALAVDEGRGEHGGEPGVGGVAGVGEIGGVGGISALGGVRGYGETDGGLRAGAYAAGTEGGDAGAHAGVAWREDTGAGAYAAAVGDDVRVRAGGPGAGDCLEPVGSGGPAGLVDAVRSLDPESVGSVGSVGSGGVAGPVGPVGSVGVVGPVGSVNPVAPVGSLGFRDPDDDAGLTGAVDRGPAELIAPVPRRGVEGDREWLNRGALSFLAEASDLLAGQLDEDLVAALAGQLLVPRLADWCAVWLEDETLGWRGSDGSLGPAPRLARVWHGSENRIEDLRKALEKDPPRLPESVRSRAVPVPWPRMGVGDTEAVADTGAAAGSAASAASATPASPAAEAAAVAAAATTGAAVRPGAAAGAEPAPASRRAGGSGSSCEGRGKGGPGDGVEGGSALAYRLIAGGRPLGTLVIGRAGLLRFPDELTGLVEDLSRRIALAIGAARQYARQATISRVLQRGLLPGAVAEIPGVTSALVYEPRDKGGPSGDFYDLFPAGRGRWCFALGDVQGKGPEAAVVIGLARPWLRLLAREGYGVADVLDRLNQLLLDDATETADAAARALVTAGDPGLVDPEASQTRFLSLLYGELVPFDGGVRCTLASAGHPLPLLLGPDGDVRTVAEPQTLLGVIEDAEYVSETFELRPGDTLLSVTDGVTERRSGPVMFDDGDGLASALAGCAGLNAQLIAERIRRLVHEFGQGAPEDDLALLVLQAE